MECLRFCLNGRWVEETNVSPTTTVLRYLRDAKGLAGTKEGCAEGDCGACTVAVSERGPDGKPHWRAVNSCLLLLPMVQGKQVVTVEALKDGARYHPAQEAMAQALGSQCGYCTPGVVMSLFEATYRSDLDQPWKLDDQLCGNLCRCTGYRPIVDAAKNIAGSCPADRFAQQLAQPNEAMKLSYQAQGQRFFTPASFEELWSARVANPDARFVVGGTDVSLEITKRFAKLPALISLEGIAELHRLETRPDGVFIGSTVTLSELEAFAARFLPPVARMVRYFGARQIKHRATVGGNLCTASPIGDLAPVLISLGATAVVRGSAGERRMPLEDFFLAYRKTALSKVEVLAGVDVPVLGPQVRATAFKVSKRRELDISTVAAGMLVELNGEGVVTRARLAFGGMAATPKRAAKAEAALVGKPWNEAAVEAAASALKEDFAPISDHRGSGGYRARVAANLIRGFFEETLLAPVPELPAQHAGTVQTYREAAHGE
ncbi:MAG: xanthine dehydrogenase small subunit [Myxococcaceae bacterium]